MTLTALVGDITKIESDVIVNAANPALVVGGGVDGAIHKAAGPELLEANKQLHPFGCQTGQVRVTPAFNLPAQYVFHTVGPDMREVVSDGYGLLSSCYQACVAKAFEMRMKSISFPAISTGVFGFPQDAAAKIAAKSCADYVYGLNLQIDVKLVCFDDEQYKIISKSIAEQKDQYVR